MKIYWQILKVFQMKVLTLLLLVMLLNHSALGWPWSWNRYDKKEQKHGRWRTFHTEGNTQTVHFKGRYKHGRECGRWKTYTPDGKLYFKEKFKPRLNQVITTYFHPNGKVSHKGVAYQYETKKGIWSYYWEGEWKFYDESGAYLGSRMYEKGKVKGTTYLSETNY